MAEMVEIPAELAYFQLPDAVQERLQFLDCQDSGKVLTPSRTTEQKDLSSWRILISARVRSIVQQE